MRIPVADSYEPVAFLKFNTVASAILFMVIWFVGGTIFSGLLFITYPSPIYGIGNVIAILEPFIDMFIFGLPASMAILMITSVATLVYTITERRKKGKETVVPRNIAIIVVGITVFWDLITIPGIIFCFIYLGATGQWY